MLRHNDAIRLTPKEREVFSAMTGDGRPAPTTVAEHNGRLESAERAWAAGDSPEEQLAALLARDMMLAPSHGQAAGVQPPDGSTAPAAQQNASNQPDAADGS